jgi:sigma-B regulation protein RsbU (phosphoserine phosphatase)
VELLEIGGPVIGAFPNMKYESSAIKLNPGDVLFLFTDGLSEAMNENGEEYTEERIRQFICDSRNHEPHLIMNMILEDVQKFDPHIPPQDDTTIIAMKMTQNGLILDGRQA